MWTVLRGNFVEREVVSDGNSIEKSKQGLLELRTPVSVETTFFRVDTVFNGNLGVWEMCSDHQRILQ